MNNFKMLLRKKYLIGFLCLVIFLNIEAVASKSDASIKSVESSNSVLSTGNWFKIQIDDEGVYKLTYSQIVKIGIAQPQFLRIFGNGGSMLGKSLSEKRNSDLNEIALHFNLGADGVFSEGDYVLFFAKGMVDWQYDPKNAFFKHRTNEFSNSTYYFLSSDFGNGKKVNFIDQESRAVDKEIRTYDHYQYHELDEKNLLKSGSQWIGERFSYASPVTVNFIVPSITSDEAKVYYNTVLRSVNKNKVFLNYNNQTISVVNSESVNLSAISGMAAFEANAYVKFVPASNNISFTIGVSSDNDPGAEIYLDYVEINAREQLLYRGTQLQFRDYKSVGSGSFAKFTIAEANSNLMIWDVTDRFNCFGINAQFSNNVLSFTARADSLKEYVVFNPDKDTKTPVFLDKNQSLVSNQNLRGLPNVDLIIVSPSEKGIFLQAQRMASLRTNIDGLKVALVTTDQVYNEFSSGMPDVSAIRDFASYMFRKFAQSSNSLKYLLLFGDGSYDNKYTSPNNQRHILTYQSAQSFHNINSYVTDDFYGWLNDTVFDKNATLDIGVGRFPIKDSIEARQMVDKYYEYASSFGEWRNNICFLADDEDGNLHMSQSDSLANYVIAKQPQSIVRKIFFDAFPQKNAAGGSTYPDVVKTLSSTINNGVLLFNYTGHGNEKQLSEENVINKSIVGSWRNRPNYPVFITATCEFSRYDDVGVDRRNVSYSDRTTAGEQTILQPSAGAIAMLTTSRIVYSSDNNMLNQSVFKFFFNKDSISGEYYRIGDIVRLSKNSIGINSNKLNFTLLGDPSLKIALPQINGVVTDSINGIHVVNFIDTLKALQKIKISGYVNDRYNNFDSLFIGEINITLFDKELKKNTLNNDKYEYAFSYKDRSVVLYKGKASVVNGRFVLSFLLPKDINYMFGEGKMIYYAQNGKYDINGEFNDFTLGGLASNAVGDKVGPEISIFMNDTTFRSGDITNDQPLLLVKLSDINGINISDMGIGHEITAILDGDATNAIILNNYYTSETNSFSDGLIKYRLNGLSNGVHYLEIKAYDSYNNVSRKTITFKVISQNELYIANVRNYPNPFSQKTTFEVTHNRAEEKVEVDLRIYNLMGGLVKQIKVNNYSVSYRALPIEWNGTSDNGTKQQRGIYIYKITLRTVSGESTYASGKLMIK